MLVGYKDFADGIAALSITGVTRNYGTEPPASLKTADLPASFVISPRGQNDPFAFTGGATTAMLTVQLVVCIEPVGQNLASQNAADTLTLIDATVTALAGTNVGISKSEFEIRQVIYDVGGESYWALIANVSARG